MKAVLVVEDHPLVAEAMRDMLARSAGDFEPSICPDAQSALRAISDPNQNWFRIFLDLDVPGAHGLSLAREIHRLGFHARCCVVTALNRQDLINEVRGMGFLGYLVKAKRYDEFEEAVRQVLAGDLAFPDVGKCANKPPIRLTRKQLQLLEFAQRGLSSKEIATTLFQAEGTINNGINAAMRALGVTSRTHAVAKAIELGLLSFNTCEAPSPAQYRQSQ